MLKIDMFFEVQLRHIVSEEYLEFLGTMRQMEALSVRQLADISPVGREGQSGERLSFAKATAGENGTFGAGLIKIS
jgi:hypothetical protein